MSTETSAEPALARVRRLLSERWPEACEVAPASAREVVRTGIAGLDSLFPDGGIPCGSWVEITGRAASGKTSLLFSVLAQLDARERVVYFDFPKTFYPAAAAAAGVDLRQVRVARSGSLPEALHTAEKLFGSGEATVLVFDLVSQREHMPQVLAHRLRQQVLRGGAVALFLTHAGHGLIGQSLMALCLCTTRRTLSHIDIAVVRSRIGREGVRIPWIFSNGVARHA